MRQSFIVYRRPGGGKGGKVYYAAFWDESARTYNRWRSTAKTGSGAAKAVAKKWEAEGLPSRSKDTLAEYLKEFWRADGSFAKLSAARRRGRRALSHAYLSNNARSIEKYVVPFLEDQGKDKIPIPAVTAALIEALMKHLLEEGRLSPRTINTVRQAMAVPLGEAERLGLIPKNPARQVRPLEEDRLERKILSAAEVKALFALEWTDPRLLTANVLAATTGLRMGEIRGLQAADVCDGFLHVCHNVQDGEGIKVPKSGSARDVPLPARTEAALRELIRMNPWKDGIVFYSTKPGHPVPKRTLEHSFNEALDRMKIPDAERRRRGLTFHSWRYWYNSMLRGRVPDHALRALTGHHSEAMTERYTEITADQRREIARLANGLVAAPGKRQVARLP